MTNNKSPSLTSCPSSKWISVRYPLTRARISTYSLAANCPVYSSHSTSSRWRGWLTVTAGGAGGGSAARPRAGCHDPTTRKSAAVRRKTVAEFDIIRNPPFAGVQYAQESSSVLNQKFLFTLGLNH